jgi:hypothetical protein
MPFSKKLARCARRSLLTLAVVATLAVGFVVVENWRGARAWHELAAEYAARGEPLDKLPAPASLPPERNYMQTPVLERWLFAKDDSPEKKVFLDGMAQPDGAVLRWREGKGFDLVGHSKQQQLRRSKLGLPELPAKPTPAAAVLAALEPAEPVLSELRQALAPRPEAQAMRPAALTRGASYTAPITSFRVARLLVTTFSAHACASLAEGRTDVALEDTLAALRLSRGFLDMPDPCLVETMIGVVCSRTALQPVWEGCTRNQWTEPQLAQLQQELARLRPLDAQERCLRTARSRFVCMLDSLSPAELVRLHEFPRKRESRWNPVSLLPSGWVQRNKMAGVRVYEAGIAAAAAVGTPEHPMRAAARAEAEAVLHERSFRPFVVLAQMMVPAMGKVTANVLGGATDLDLARVACALERHRLAHGGYPERLEALSPAYLETVPHDVIDGMPLRYRRNADGTFALYSIGSDGKDDGGVPTNKDRRGAEETGDWIWPRLAQ